MLLKCASTSLSSKLVAHQKDFFSNMVVDAVLLLDELLPLNMIGIKKVTGGALEVGYDQVEDKMSYRMRKPGVENFLIRSQMYMYKPKYTTTEC